MKKNLKYPHGQAIVLIVLGIVGLIGLTALAIDGGNAYSDRRHAQNAADTAAFASALDKLSGGTAATIVNAGEARAVSNGYNNDGTTNTVVVNNPPQNSQYDCAHIPATCNDYIQVIITSNVKTFFAPVVGIPQVTNTVQSVAHAKPGNPNLPWYGGNTVVGLAPSGCDSVQFCGNAQLQIWGGGVFSNSSDNCGLEFNGLGGKNQTQVQLQDGGFDMVAPSYTSKGNVNVTAKLGFTGNQTKYPYPPPPASLPNPTCSANGTYSSSNGNLTPGNFGSPTNPTDFPPGNSKTYNLAPGTYCVYGDFKVTSSSTTLTGNGVTIVMETGGLQWTGGQITLSGPTSGDYQGLTLFAPTSNTSVMSINGNPNIDLTGTLLMPGAALSLKGTSQIQKHNLQWIAKTVELCGSNDSQLYYGSSDTAKQNSAPEIQLAQ